MSKIMTTGRRAAWRMIAILGTCGFLLAAAGCSAVELPVSAAGAGSGPAKLQINTPEPLPPGSRPPPGLVFPVTPSPTMPAGSRAVANSLPAVMQSAQPTANGAARNTPAAAFALASPAFEIAPEIGVPGTTIGVVGQNWASRDVIALRLQDPANPARQAEFIIAQADESGSFHVNFTLPVNPPWSTLPALILIAFSPATGVQAARPEPFVYINPQIQQPTAQAPAPTATPTRTASPTFTPYPTPTFTPGVTATSTATQLPLPTPTNTATPVFVPTLTPTPTATQALSFNSPVATPNTLPNTGDAALGTAVVTAAELYLRAGPGVDYPALAMLTRGTVLGVAGQDATGEWLLVTTGQGAPAWVARAATSFAGAAPVSTP